ncbi:MAG: sce7726 family protein [Bacteroidia bacterium]|nr:sce7726 family protein [Bacteroidia bacterium]
MDKLRSYSSVFSSTSFQKLLQYDDYSFLNAKIDRFDKPRIGKDFSTYYDYIQLIYRALTKQYRNEYVYKNTFVNKLLLDQYGVKNTVAINEFRVGNSIADIVLFNGTSKAFEIKTELDSNKRLEGQLIDYRKIFKKCYVITHESLIEKYLQEDANIGVIELIERPKSLVMREVRAANENAHIDADTLIRSIRTPEYKSIVKHYYGELPEMTSFNMFDICRDLIKQIPNEQLNHLFIEELKKRKSNTEIISTFHNELRQLCLAMNINSNLYQELYFKLSKPINLS